MRRGVVKQKYGPSSRSVRRWWLVVALLMVAQAVVTWVWVVNPGQRLQVFLWSVAAAILAGSVHRGIPDSPERPLKPPVDRSVDTTGADLRQMFAALTPLFFGWLMEEFLPGDPSWWVRQAVVVSAALCGTAVLVLYRRHCAHRGSS